MLYGDVPLTTLATLQQLLAAAQQGISLLTDVLKGRMGFDGFVVSDWNGIAQVPGCRDAHCPQAINAGIDMVMVPEDWKAFIQNTIADVEAGRIPMSRIDDAVTRILRVKPALHRTIDRIDED